SRNRRNARRQSTERCRLPAARPLRDNQGDARWAATVKKPLDATALGVRELVAAVGARRLSAVAVAEAYLDAIAARESEVRAFVFLDRELVLAQARALDRRKGATGLRLRGVPFAVKDIIDTRDQPTECNS